MAVTSFRGLAVRPVLSEDLPELYRWACDPTTGATWRYRDRRPTREEFEIELEVGVLDQVVVIGPDGVRRGLATAYNFDRRTLSCWLAVMTSPEATGSGAGLVGGLLLVERLWDELPLRSVRVEVYEFNLPSLGALTRRLSPSVVLPDVLHWRGGWHDKHIYVIDRDWWFRAVRPLLRVHGSSRHPGT